MTSNASLSYRVAAKTAADMNTNKLAQWLDALELAYREQQAAPWYFSQIEKEVTEEHLRAVQAEMNFRLGH